MGLSEASRATGHGYEARAAVWAQISRYARTLEHPVASRSDQLTIREEGELRTARTSKWLAIVAVGTTESPGRHQPAPVGFRTVLAGVMTSPLTVF